MLMWRVVVAIIRLLLLYFRAIPTKPPRPRHIPSARSDAGTSLLASPSVVDNGGHFNVDSSVSVETAGTAGAESLPKQPAAKSLGPGGSAGREAGTGGMRPRFGSGSNCAVADRSFPAFDPFKSDSAQLPAAFGARRSGAESVGSSRGGDQQPSQPSVSRV